MHYLNLQKDDYRPDIDGLRALAVLSVFLFHLYPQSLSGGFLGVDVFFVISGYLITKIIVRENALQTFSFTHFYARRIRRIFPALFVVLLVSTCMAVILLTPETYVNFMDSAKYSSAQISNFFFSQKVGYFDEGFSGQPLLHTWSLGVEEQFYLVWPLLIFACYRFSSKRRTTNTIEISTPSTRPQGSSAPYKDTNFSFDDSDLPQRKKIAGVLLCIFLASATICYILAATNHNLAFYMFYTRAFEFCFGGFVSLGIVPVAKTKRLNWTIGLTGILFLLYSFFFIHEEHLGRSFLQLGVLLPCIGASLLIHANYKTSIANRLISTPPLVFIGKISYSFYLIHWPIIIFWKLLFSSTSLTLLESLGILGITLTLSTLNYYFIEQPARKSTLPNPHVIGAALLIIVSCIVMFNHLPQYDHTSWRIAQYKDKSGDKPNLYDKSCFRIPRNGVEFFACQPPRNPPPPIIALVGDSHALHYLRSATSWAKSNGYNVKYIKTPGCPMLLGDIHIKSSIAEEHAEKCRQSLPIFEDQIVNDPDIETILIAQRYELLHDGKGYLDTKRTLTFKDEQDQVIEDHTAYYKERLASTVKSIKNQGKNVILLKQVPLLANIKDCNWEPLIKRFFSLKRECVYDEEIPQKWQQPSIDFIDSFAATHQIDTFDPLPYFTNPLVNGNLIYSNTDHINEYGALLLAPYFEKAMNEIMKRREPSLYQHIKGTSVKGEVPKIR